MWRSHVNIILGAVTILQIQICAGTGHEKNSFIEYCSVENPGEEKICRDAEAMKEFSSKQLRFNGAFITYNSNKIYEDIVFGYGQCLARPAKSYIKLLPWAMWQKAPNIPFVVVISETIDLYTSYADQPAQIPLAGGKTHVFVLNGELRSFRGDIHRRCVALAPDLHGVNEYHFEDQDGDSFMEKYTFTNKDKIFLGKNEMQECAQYAKMDPKRDLFLRKTRQNLIPLFFEKCKLDCANTDVSIIRARNGTGLVELDEDAGLPGVLVMYAMNETVFKFSENRIYPPTFGGMLTSMYDTEVELGEFLKYKSFPAERVPESTNGDSSQNGRGITRGNAKSRQTREAKAVEAENGNLPEQKRQKRLSYSSAVFMANSLKGDGDDGSNAGMRCVG